MAEQNKKLVIQDEDGKQYEREILFTYESKDRNKKYVFFFDPNSKDDEVQVLRYLDDGSLEEVDSDEEYTELEEVFNSYIEDQDEK
ncbi:MAG: DUF1292 domain-containing protein [Bacteroidia bacterium]|nr:DUF1292 domain-containing protein [Bacteroidia bacterium]